MQRLLQILWDRYQPVPIIITESGTADQTDAIRVRYIAAILTVLHSVLEKGMDLRGYLIWTLMDNFEWAEGYRPKFGLFETNFETFERQERPMTCSLLRSVFYKG
jgi:beta-glucosidase